MNVYITIWFMYMFWFLYYIYIFIYKSNNMIAFDIFRRPEDMMITWSPGAEKISTSHYEVGYAVVALR